MFFKKLHQLISFKQLLLLLIGLAVFIQLSVIIYNHFSGFAVLSSFQHFFFRLLLGSFFSLLAGFLIAYPDLWIIQQLNKRFPWNKKLFKRILIQLIVSVFVATFIIIIVTLLVHFIGPYTDPIVDVLLYNSLIFAVVNILLMAILEAWMFSLESKKAKQVAESLHEELSQIRFEVLKSQINPHFMFNSLNVLSGLISTDAKKAEEFVDQFSLVYRYVLETIEHPVSSLKKELDFMRSYLFLQQIRYGESLRYTLNIPSDQFQKLLPPLSLQIVLENAIKHNIVNESNPLLIEIYFEDGFLMIKNQVQPKISMGKSTGLGLKNLTKRYALISKKQPVFKLENQFYLAQLPLIKSEENESTDY